MSACARRPARWKAPQRLALWRRFFAKFFPWVWVSVLLLLGSGYYMLLTTFGGFKGAPLYIHVMQGIGLLMVALFVWLFHGPWLKFKRAVDAQGLAGRRRANRAHPADHHGEPAARPDRDGDRRQRAILGVLSDVPPAAERHRIDFAPGNPDVGERAVVLSPQFGDAAPAAAVQQVGLQRRPRQPPKQRCQPAQPRRNASVRSSWARWIAQHFSRSRSRGVRAG